jgi:LPXTG-motif cell wall-anchored protein
VNSVRDKTLNVVQTYDLSEFRSGRWRKIVHDAVVAPSNVGTASMPDYAKLRKEAIYKAGDKKVFAGQADDPFFLDLRVFDLLYGGDLSEVGNDTLAGYNVNTVALQVPVHELGGAKNVIGVTSRTFAKDSHGKYRQVSRLGNPLVNEVVIPVGEKDRFNASDPKDDGQFLKRVTEPELPKVVEKVFKIKAPAEPRKDLVQVFLTGVPGINEQKGGRPSEQLRLNLTPFEGQKYSHLGVIGGDKNGFPNGRRLADDVIDASLQVVEGELVGSPNDLGDKVDANDLQFDRAFPYVALPHSGSVSVNSAKQGGAGNGAGYGAQKGAADPKAKGYGNAYGKADASSSSTRVALASESTGQNPLPALGIAALALLGGSGIWAVRRRRRPVHRG